MTGPAIRFGVLGCADVAIRKTLPVLAHHPGVRLVAVSSRSADKAVATAATFGCEPVTGYRRLLDRPDIDAVYIPLPPALHATWIDAALRAGKHVLAEKPLTPTSSQTRALADLAAESGLVLMENVAFPYHRRHRQVLELVASGRIGDPVAFTGSFTVPPRPAGDIRHSAELGGGALLDAAVYPAVAAQLVLGEDLRVAGAVLRQGSSGVDVAGAALLGRSDGATAQLTFGMHHQYTSEYQILGTLGRITVGHAFHLPAGADSEIRVHERGYEPHESIPVAADDQCGNAAAAFVRAVLTDRGGPIGSTLVPTARVLEEIRHKAIPGGGDVRIDR
ncbi:Gfo/Idh/MocA family protein [Amycolatopsis sp. CA-230715]|uniref:Gfo/Idh/MocA family protein n=1 Tax=Amycolatopsis sp. CA-230715 TaxID=2745196 RepID=UPI001C010BC9|nr:Gfo/Idh/MocA family oxidoreductase [Amycolatopsis sp. CA-230715]QWF84530.1 Inositol 2-dehydrogenase/D-chiro-inositol 3-dehydrogenase [Amycolatopsis sp. CA-230715]